MHLRPDKSSLDLWITVLSAAVHLELVASRLRVTTCSIDRAHPRVKNPLKDSYQPR